MTALEEIKKALEGVTHAPGKWEAEGTAVYCDDTTGQRVCDTKGEYLFWSEDQKRNAAVYIAAANPVAISELLSTLESVQRENEELRNLADRLKQEAKTHAIEARGANSTIAEIYQIISGGKGEPGNWRGAKPVREYVEAAKGEILRLETELALSKPVYSRRQIEARVKALEEALKPFAEYMGDHFDKDNHGKPLPDDLGVGWIYLTHADFRRARTALASTGGERHGN